MRYYKNDAPAMRDAWEVLNASKKELHTVANEFADSLGGVAVISRSAHEFRLQGISFEPAKPTDIWTAKDKDYGTQRPRSAPRSGCAPAQREELKTLKADFYARFPKASASLDPLYAAVGTDWGNALFGGVALFELDGVSYIETGVTLNDECIEILGSEYADAKARALTNKKATEA